MPVATPEIPVWARKIADTRKRLGFNQKAFAAKLRTTQSNVSKWESGAYKPSPEQFMAIADLAKGDPSSLLFMELGGVSPDFFMGRNGTGVVPSAVAANEIRKAEERAAASLIASGYLLERTGDVRHVPLLKDAAAAGTPRAVDETEVEEYVGLPKKWTGGGGELFLVPVEGDSMSPILESGYQALVDVSRNEMPKLEKHIVLARVGDGVTIKYLRRDGDTFLLVPQHVSQRHPVQIIRPDSDIEVVGEVVMWIGHPLPAKKGR
jgi:SOS-response transcriptional repressor LexA/DNA-binding XRE family transcriptional regulator